MIPWSYALKLNVDWKYLLGLSIRMGHKELIAKGEENRAAVWPSLELGQCMERGQCDSRGELS